MAAVAELPLHSDAALTEVSVTPWRSCMLNQRRMAAQQA
jgi:hypothetical protein